MTRPWHGWLALALCIPLASCGRDDTRAPTGSRGGQRPNLLLISVDTCRADAFGSYDESRSTPSFDALARRAVRFRNAIAPVPITLPSHSTMLTGTNPPYHGVHDNGDYRLADFNVSLAEVARDAGYDTAAFVAAFVLDARFGLDQGFNTFDDELDDENAVGLSERKAARTSDAAIAWLERPRERPFFLFAHYYDPHQAYEPPPPFAPAKRTARALYDGEVSYTDHHVGRLLKRIEDLGLFENTLIIVTSDHGEMLDEHGERSHTFFVYQGVLHVPLIIKPPERDTARVVEQRVGIVDIVPTACALLGLPAPEVLHGADLTVLLEGREPATSERFIYCESMTPTLYGASPLLGLVTQRWKYLHTTRPELYDLELDPGETNNLATAEPERAAALREKLRSLLAEQHRGGDEARAETDAAALEKIRALGYAGGGARAEFDLDAMVRRDDPKDLVGFAHSDQVLQVHISAGEIAEARALGATMLELRPDSVRTRLAMAWLCLDAGELEASLEHSRRAIELEPESKKAHYVHGLALEKSGNTALALEHYRIVVRLWPENMKAQFRLGSLLLRGGDARGAIPHLEKALEDDPNLVGAQANLGSALLAVGRTQEALERFETAARLQPESAPSHLNRAVALAALGRSEDALAAFRRTLELDPSQLQALVGQAELLASDANPDLRDPERALELAERSVQWTQRQVPRALDALAMAQAAAGRFDEAAATATEALELAEASGAVDYAGEVRARLELYRSGQAFVR